MNALDPILYPAIEPYQADYLAVSSLHDLYFEQSFHLVPDTGHSAIKVRIATKTIEATNAFRDRL